MAVSLAIERVTRYSTNAHTKNEILLQTKATSSHGAVIYRNVGTMFFLSSVVPECILFAHDVNIAKHGAVMRGESKHYVYVDV